MRLASFLDRSRTPLGVLAVLLATATFAAHLAGAGRGLAGRLLAVLDLRLEGNLGTVLETLLFLACGASFLLLARVPKPAGRFETWQLRFYRVAAAACVFLAADELFSFHVFLGRALEADTRMLAGQRVDRAGFSWLLLYGPACVAFLVLVRRACHRPARFLVNPELRRDATRALILGIIATLLVLVFKTEEAWLANQARTTTLIPCFKETMELVALWAILTGNLLLARGIAAEAATR